MNMISFKQVWTSHTACYPVNYHWTLSQMIRELGSRLSEEFNIPEAELELVPNNHRTNTMQPVELLPAIREEDLPKTLKDLYGSDLCIGFYVRQRNQTLPETIVMSPCVICFEERITTAHFGCRHQICSNCAAECNRARLSRCPWCR